MFFQWQPSGQGGLGRLIESGQPTRERGREDTHWSNLRDKIWYWCSPIGSDREYADQFASDGETWLVSINRWIPCWERKIAEWRFVMFCLVSRWSNDLVLGGQMKWISQNRIITIILSGPQTYEGRRVLCYFARLYIGSPPQDCLCQPSPLQVISNNTRGTDGRIEIAIKEGTAVRCSTRYFPSSL